MGQAITLARYYFKDDSPTDQTLAQAIWLHREMCKTQRIAVQNGMAAAFKGKG